MSRSNLTRIIVACAAGLLLAQAPTPAFAVEEVAKLTPSDAPEFGGGFGVAVAISGDWIVVGAPSEGGVEGQALGSAYIFRRQDGGWVEHAKLTASPRIMGDTFGASVAIDGDSIVVGVPAFSELSPGPARAYVYRYDGAAWNEEAMLIPSGSFDDDCFGESVSISGDLIAIGAPGTEFSASQVYVYRGDSTIWTEEAILVGADTDDADAFGSAVSASDDTVVVGAPYDSDLATDAGSVYVFFFNGSAWAQQAKLTAPDAQRTDLFGDAVCINNDEVIVGARGDDDAGSGSGAAYLFRRDEGIWLPFVKLVASDATLYDQFGRAVAMRGSVVVVGAPGDDPHGDHSGAAYLFRRHGSHWLEAAKYVPTDSDVGHRFGWSASIDGDTAVVGTNGPRAAYVFDTSIEIPTVSSWGVMALGAALLGAGVVMLRRRRHMSCSSALRQITAVGVCLLALGGTTVAQVSMLNAPHHPERLLVRFKVDTSESGRQAVHAAHAAVELKRYQYVEGLTPVKVRRRRDGSTNLTYGVVIGRILDRRQAEGIIAV